MSISRLSRLVCCLTVLSLVSGCGARSPRSISTQGAKPGAKGPADPAPSQAKKTTQTTGKPKTSLPKETLESHIAKVRQRAAESRASRTGNIAPSLEMLDPRLAEARKQLAAEQTAENYRLVGAAYHRLGVLDQAHDHYAHAVRLEPSDATSLDAMARIWRDWGLPHLGLGDAYRAIYHAPESAAAHNTLGTLLQAMGRHKEARKVYRRALVLDPNASYALNNLCYSWLYDGQAALAESACRDALKANPQLVAAQNNLGLVYASAGKLEQAAEAFGEVGGAAGYYNLGMVHLARGQFDDAARAFETAHQLEPSMTQAADRARQARLRSMKGSNFGGQ